MKNHIQVNRIILFLSILNTVQKCRIAIIEHRHIDSTTAENLILNYFGDIEVND